MIISRRRDLKVSMGNYESYAFGASVTLSHTDLGYSDEEVQQYLEAVPVELTEMCERLLTDLLKQEVRDAQDLTEEKRSFILAALDEPKAKTVNRRES